VTRGRKSVFTNECGNNDDQYIVIHNHEHSMSKPPFFILYFLFFTLKTFSQAPQLGVNIEDEFKVTTVPDKWKNESAVIIGQKTEYLFTRLLSGRNFSTVVRINEYIHKRIKLQDKNALEKFSTFNYVTMGKDGNAEYKIVKAGGKEETVDMKAAVDDEKDLDPIYKPIFLSLNINSKKLPFPISRSETSLIILSGQLSTGT